ncbi:MAG: protein kinase [Planctomycetota bacterium]
MTWIENHWQQLRFNRLDFERKYVVDQVLSQKPRSQVFLTRRRGSRQQTIMKLIERTAANPQEVECLRSLKHPGIARYLGHGVTRDRRQWMEMEYIDGIPLSAWLDEQSRFKGKAGNAPDRGQAKAIFLQLVSVVQYLHCCGWIHGDLSPQNILISAGDRGVVLIDFEHACSSDISNVKTMPRKHSLSYASPHEEAGGATTEACEQYSLGKIGFMMLAPFVDQVGQKLQAVLVRATSANPEDRYPNLFAFAGEIENAVSKI